MSWSGTGAFTRSNGTHTGSSVWTDDKNAGTKITSSNHDTHDQDLADGINACLAKNGENAMTGNLDLGGNDLTNGGAAVFTAATLLNGWTNLNTTGYYKDHAGFVHIRGAVSGAAKTGNTVFTLPAAYRPVDTEYFTTFDISSGSPLVLQVSSAGNVIIPTAGTDNYSLTGVCFSTS